VFHEQLESSRLSLTFVYERLHVANKKNDATLAKFQESKDENANLVEQLEGTNVTVAEVTSVIGMLHAAMNNLNEH